MVFQASYLPCFLPGKNRVRAENYLILEIMDWLIADLDAQRLEVEQFEAVKAET